MEDSSFPTQSVVSAHLSDGLVEVADCLVDSNFAYPSLKSDISVLGFTLEFTMALLNPLVNTKTWSWVLQMMYLSDGCSVDPC